MLLAGDIGGTKTNLALFDEKSEQFVGFDSFPSRSYSNLKSIVLEYFSKHSVSSLRGGCFAVAGPVKEGICHTTNLPWVVNCHELSKAIKLAPLFLINDLEANAYALDILQQDQLFSLYTPEYRVEGNRTVVSPGTGLGEAGLFWDGKRYHPFSCEGGHSEFGPRTQLEVELSLYLIERFKHPSYERILSGPGIRNLFDFFVRVKKRTPPSWLLEEMQQEDSPAVISKNGLSGRCDICVDALKLFVSILGAEAGNCALKFMAFGGVFLGGGIPLKILPALKDPLFLQGFREKGRLKEILLSMPVSVILDNRASLRGAAHYAISSLR